MGAGGLVGFDRGNLGGGGSGAMTGGGAVSAASGGAVRRSASGNAGGPSTSETEAEFRRIMRSGNMGSIFSGMMGLVNR